MASEKSVMAVIRASRPSFRNNFDKAVFAVHASFLASGYVLVATGPPAFADNALSDTSTGVDEVGIDHWNELDDDYAFVYVNPEKGSKKVLVKCLVMNGKLLVDALAEGGPEPVHLEINVGDYVEQNQGTNYAAHYKKLGKLVKDLDAEIFSKLYGPPMVRPSDKPSSSETRETSRYIRDVPVLQSYTSGSETREERRHIQDDPDPQPYPSRIVYPPVPVNPIGGSDLFPGPGAGMFPSRGDVGSGGGMLLGPNDPRWFGFEGGEPGFPGRPAGVPPGARFDPINPPGLPGFDPNGINRYPGRPRGGTHPDLEHFRDGPGFI